VGVGGGEVGVGSEAVVASPCSSSSGMLSKSLSSLSTHMVIASRNSAIEGHAFCHAA